MRMDWQALTLSLQLAAVTLIVLGYFGASTRHGKLAGSGWRHG